MIFVGWDQLLQLLLKVKFSPTELFTTEVQISPSQFQLIQPKILLDLEQNMIKQSWTILMKITQQLLAMDKITSHILKCIAMELNKKIGGFRVQNLIVQVFLTYLQLNLEIFRDTYIQIFSVHVICAIKNSMAKTYMYMYNLSFNLFFFFSLIFFKTIFG